MTRLWPVGLRPISSSSLPLASSEPSRFRFAFRRLARFPRWPIRLTPSPSINVPLDTSAASTWRSAWQQPVYHHPDSIPEFAKAETRKFEDELRKKILKSNEVFSDGIVKICEEVNKLPGAGVAARASILQGQNYLDQDREIWNFQQSH